MRKFFSFVMALVAAVTLNAATQVTFDFSDATAYGYANPEAGKSTQVENGAVLTKDGVTITIAFTSGNGFRFFAHSNTGAVNLRGYVGASYTIAAPEGKKLAAIAADGSNLTSQYLSGGMTSAEWSSATGVESLATNVIKSTVQFNSLVVTLIEDGEVPPTQENIQVDVAGAIAAGMALDSAKTSTDVYDVTGYVVDAQAYSKDHGNQIWFMADDAANTGEQVFEAYACTVSENNTVMQVLNGDKVTLTGKITRYYDKNNKKFIIEIKNGTAVFISKVEGDHSIDGGTVPGGDTTQVPLDTITVAQALEIGKALQVSNKNNKYPSEKSYVIKGYTCGIEQAYDTTYKNETFWISDTKGTRTTDKALAFEVYRGKPNPAAEIGLDALVQFTCKILNFNGTIENYDSNLAVEVLEPGIIEVPDTITVAQAITLAQNLTQSDKDNKYPTEKSYTIKGYVSSIDTYYDPTYKNETFWITDEKGDRTSDKNVAFEVYRGKPNPAGEVGLDAYVQLTCKIINFGGTAENFESGPTVDVLEQGLPVVVDTISVTKALEIGNALDDNAYTDNPYVVIGYVTKAYEPDSGKTAQNFYMADEPNVQGDFYAYKANPDTKINKGDYVQLFGKIQKYVSSKGTTIELSYGTAVHLEAPKIDTLSVAEALEVGMALEDNTTSEKRYYVRGYVAVIDVEFEEDIQSFTLSDDKAATSGAFKAIDAIIAEPGAKLHDQVILIGHIEKTVEEGVVVISMSKADAQIVWAEGVENIVLTEQARKVMIDGVIYIIRDNKVFNLQGTQVR